MGRRRGCVPPNRKDPWQRILDNSERADSGCLVWTGHVSKSGYGRVILYDRVSQKHKVGYAHRLSFAISQGISYWDIPPFRQSQLDHLCRNRACVEPSHLELVTPQENIGRSLRARGIQQPYRRSRGTRISKQPCENHVLVRNSRQLHCRECDRRNERRYKDKKAGR